MVDLPQYYENTLKPVPITEESLQQTADEFLSYMRKASKQIKENITIPDKEDNNAYGNIFSGYLGKRLLSFKLKNSLTSDHPGSLLGLTNAGSQIPTIIDQPDEEIFQSDLEWKFHLGSSEEPGLNIPVFPLDLMPGRPSPLVSTSLGALLLRFKQLEPKKEQDIEVLGGAIEQALTQPVTVEMRGRRMGGDEVLIGRAGLLWMLLEMSKQRFWTLNMGFDPIVDGEGDVKELVDIANEAIPKLARVIIAAGREGAEQFGKAHGEQGKMALMWPWIDDYVSLGSMHGITSILAALLDRQIEMLDGSIKEYYPAIAETVTALCKVCMANDGHLPTSIPDWPSKTSRSSPLVQICHGTPGLLLLLAAAAQNLEFSNAYYKMEWIEAMHLGAQRVWEQGLLSKGGGLCHGIAGNAWPLLMLHDCVEFNYIPVKMVAECSDELRSIFMKDERPTGDWLLSRALAMLQECRNTRPFSSDEKYMMPDNPYSLFGGLTGTMSAWSEAVLAIQARLLHMKAMERALYEFPKGENKEVKMRWLKLLMDRLGFPGVGVDFAFYKTILKKEIEKSEEEEQGLQI